MIGIDAAFEAAGPNQTESEMAIKQWVQASSFTLVMGFSSHVSAESTLVLDLQEQLTRQADSYSQQLNKIEKLNEDLDTTRALYDKTRTLPRGSRDHKYAVSRYVEQRLDSLEPKLEAVKALRGLNWEVSDTVGRLSEAIREQNAEGANAGLRGLNAQALEHSVSHMAGSDRIMNALTKDPALASSPEFESVVRAHHLGTERLMGSVEGVNADVSGQLDKLNRVIEAQGVLLEIAWQQLREDANRLQVIETTGMTSMEAVKIQEELDNVFGVFGDEKIEKTRARDIGLLNNIFVPVSTRSSGSYGGSSLSDKIESFRAKYVR